MDKTHINPTAIGKYKSWIMELLSQTQKGKMLNKIFYGFIIPYSLIWLLLWFFDSIIKAKLDIFVENYIEKCNKQAFLAIVIILIFRYGFTRISNYKKYRAIISHNDIVMTSSALWIYAYFRLFHHSDYEFWALYGPIAIVDLLFLIFILQCIFLCLNYFRTKSINTYSDYLISDTPIENEDDDLYGFHQTAKTLYSNLKKSDISKHAFKACVIAPWGCGKSSLLNLIAKHAEKENDIIIRFNPRLSKSPMYIQEDFFETFSQELSKYHTGISYLTKKYIRALHLIEDEKWYIKILGLWPSYISTDEKSKINNAIRDIKKTIWVLIEDLDRLTAEEIMEVLKLIDNNSNFQNTIFITAYDNSYVNEVMEKRNGASHGQAFINKYFDYEIILPLPKQDALYKFFNKHIEKHLTFSDKDNCKTDDFKTGWNELAWYVLSHLKSIRHVKHFLNIFLPNYIRIKNDVNLHDYLLLTLLLYMDVNVYNLLSTYSILKRGNNLFIKTNKYHLRTNYKELIKKVSIWDESENLLKRLFPDAEATIKDEDLRTNDSIWSVLAFSTYFYDYEDESLYYKDFIQVFKAEDDMAAYTFVDKLMHHAYNVKFSAYLLTRKDSWVKGICSFDHFFRVLIYALKYDDSLARKIDEFLYESKTKEAIQLKLVDSMENYKNIIDSALLRMSDLNPYHTGIFCIERIGNLLNNLYAEDYNILTIDSLNLLAKRCQHNYYMRFGQIDWNYTYAYELSQIKNKGEVQYDETARNELISLMKKYPNNFAKNIIYCYLNHPNPINKISDLFMRFNPKFELEKIFPYKDFSFMDWLNMVTEADAKFVIVRIYVSIKNTGYGFSVPGIKEDHSNKDIIGLREAIEANDKQNLHTS